MALRCLLVLLIAAIGELLTPAAVVSAGPTQRFCVSGIRGRFDSDRRRDTAVVYSTRPGCETTNGRSWQLVVRLASGRALRRALGSDQPAFSGERDLGCDSRCVVRAAPDFNRDGAHEIEVALHEVASQEERGIYGVVGGALRRLPGSPTGDRFSLSYGGGLTHGAYVVCRMRGVRHLVIAVGWGIADKTHSAVREDIYQFEGLRFRLLDTKTQRMSTSVIPPRVSGRTC